FGRLLPWFLGNWTLFDPDQRFSVGAIENVDPTGAAGLGNPLSRLAIDHRVEQDHRAPCIVVPNVVMDFLEVPHIFASLGLQCATRSTEGIVAFARRAAVIRPAITDGEVHQPELWIERRRVPDRGPTADRIIGAGRPSIAADLARAGQGIPSPQDLA